MERLGDLRRAVLSRKWMRYSLVSVVSVTVGQTILAVTFGVLHWSAPVSAVVATAIGTVPSYVLNRRWVWGRRGKQRLVREIAAFWTMAFVALGLSAWSAAAADRLGRQLSEAREVRTLAVMAGNMAAFGVLWVVRFIVLDRFLFVAKPGSEVAAVSTSQTVTSSGP